MGRKVVAARDKEGLSWLRTWAKFKLAEGAASLTAGASRASQPATSTSWSSFHSTAHQASAMIGDGMNFKVGDTVEIQWRPERPVTVNERMYEAVARLRSATIVAALRRSTLTYTEAERAIDLLYPARGLGAALDLLSYDCIKRREPSLAALVVRKDSGEVGEGFIGGAAAAAAEREKCYEGWSRK